MSIISVSEAIAKLGEHSSLRVGSETCELKEAAGRILAKDIVATLNVPPADNSAMDGYALRRADWSDTDQVLAISQRITAGMPPQPLKAGTAARIFTGAEIPDGADSVVIQENCVAGDASVTIRNMGPAGSNI